MLGNSECTLNMNIDCPLYMVVIEKDLLSFASKYLDYLDIVDYAKLILSIIHYIIMFSLQNEMQKKLNLNFEFQVIAKILFVQC